MLINALNAVALPDCVIAIEFFYNYMSEKIKNTDNRRQNRQENS